MELLRSDLEMRKVQEKLQLGKDRDAYRLEYRGASRLDTVTSPAACTSRTSSA
jgi:hypothetical protein